MFDGEEYMLLFWDFDYEVDYVGCCGILVYYDDILDFVELVVDGIEDGVFGEVCGENLLCVYFFSVVGGLDWWWVGLCFGFFGGVCGRIVG